MAPEILRYQKYGANVDLWSVGAVLFEMSVGRPPFRAQNHIELLKKIEQSRGVKFPDEDPHSSAGKSGGGGSTDYPVPDDLKKLIRILLRQNPLERSSFDDFFSSEGLKNSKSPAPVVPDGPPIWSTDRSSTPEHHRIIPPEVLDPNAMIPPSRFNFRRPSSGALLDGSPVARPNLTLGDG